MNILLTNDDGIACNGIQVLAETLRKNHNIWTIAPDRNRSAVSHALTMTVPLKIQRLDTQTFSCSGVPADCTMTGLLGVMKDKPDAVISGINQGVNIGTDVLYSGTAAAARQASLFGIPAIALSVAPASGSWEYAPLAEFVLQNLDTLMRLCEKDVFLNINAPSARKYKGCLLTTLSRRKYNDTLQLYEAPDGHSYSFFAGGTIETEGERNSDWNAVEDGYVSVTRVRAQPMCAGHDEFADTVFTVNGGAD